MGIIGAGLAGDRCCLSLEFVALTVHYRCVQNPIIGFKSVVKWHGFKYIGEHGGSEFT